METFGIVVLGILTSCVLAPITLVVACGIAMKIGAWLDL